MTIKEIKLGRVYKASKGFVLFPQCVVLIGKVDRDRYSYFDVATGERQSYLTDRDLTLVYEEWKEEC